MAKRHRSNKRNPLGGIVGLGIILILAYVLLKVVLGTVSLIWGVLAFAAPLLFIAAMFLNFGVVKDYATMLKDTFKKDSTRGLIYTLGSVFGYPFVSLFLFFKAYTTRKDQKIQEGKVKNKKAGEEYVEFEEMENEDDFLELPDIEEDLADPEAKPMNRYDDLFSE